MTTHMSSQLFVILESYSKAIERSVSTFWCLWHTFFCSTLELEYRTRIYVRNTLFLNNVIYYIKLSLNRKMMKF
jgi:hypothetical protein